MSAAVNSADRDRWVVIVDPYANAGPMSLQFRAHGFRTATAVTTAQPPDMFTHSTRPDHFDLAIPHTDERHLADRLRGMAPIAVLPGSEHGVELAERLAGQLTPAFANERRTAKARRHKGDMVRRVGEAGLATIRTVCTSDPGEVSDWLVRERLVGQDLVVKPPRCAGGHGVVGCPRGADWRIEFDRVLGARDCYGNVSTDVVVQERVWGHEYAVNTMSCDGRHVVTSICRYRKVSGARHLAAYQAIEFVPRTGLDGLVDYANRVLDALGVRFGPCHVEVMRTKAGPVLVEVGARFPGSGLTDVSAMATDTDPFALLASLVAGAALPMHDYTLRLPTVLRYFVIPSGGIVRNVEVLRQATGLSSYFMMSTGLVNGERVSSDSDVWSTIHEGWVILANQNVDELYADCAKINAIEAQLVVDPC